MTCNCIGEIERLNPDNKLEIAIMLRGNSLTAETCTNLLRSDNGKRESRSGKPKIAAHTFCPFCGTRYAEGQEGGGA